MSDDDPILCCATGVCCPDAEREDRLVKAIHQDMGSPEEHVRATFCWIDERFDLVPKGKIQPLIDWVAEHAKKHDK